MNSAPLSHLARRAAELREHFHSPLDFGDGFNTKPAHVQRRFQRRLRLLQIPDDLTGKTVLDVGAWDGFFSFEFERRGAKVTSIDSWTGPHALETFLLARERFGSKAAYHRLDVHDISPETVGGTFDIVFCAGVLYHLRHPLLGLERLRSVTREMLILETSSLIPAVHESAPLISFFPGDQASDSGERFPGGFSTKAWVSAALKAAGFDRHEFIYTPSWRHLKKLAALLTNRPRYGRLIARAYVDGLPG
jgi:tRNA (mo5U34)-methyltransferase